MKSVRLKGPNDLTSKVIAKLNTTRPRTEGALTYDVSRSTVSILSKVKYVLSTGIDPFDAALGIGGLPFGRIVEIYGLDGSCKSAVALRCATRMQERKIFTVERADRQAKPQLVPIDDKAQVFTIYIDNEQSIDEDGKTIIDGVSLDCAVARCETVDQMFKIMDVAIDEVKKVTSEEGVECFILVVIDTIAGTSSREEQEAKWEDVDYPRQAKQLREGFRIMTRKLARENVLVIATNQVGDNYKKRAGGYGNSMVPQDADFNTFGGRALKYYASVRIFQYKMNVDFKLNKKLRFPSGMTIGFTVVKNRLGKPWRSGQMVLLYEGGLNNTYSRLQMLLHLKLAEYLEGGLIAFKFGGAGIATTTFTDEGRSRNPRLESLDQWPAFYEQHKADFDLLWDHGMKIMFEEQQIVEATDDDSDIDIDED